MDAASLSSTITMRLATTADRPALEALMQRAIRELQAPFLAPDQLAASAVMMGLDQQLIDDGSYFIAEIDGRIAGCGGWSWRATLYGGSASPGRDARLLDPASDPARVRAMYTHPDFTRRGVGRAILAACEAAARAAGFMRVELMGTRAGQPLYLAAGYRVLEEIIDTNGPAPVPMARMGKDLTC